MTRPLRVLLLEDTPEDVELAAAELRRAGLVVDLRVEQTGAGLRAAREEFRPDVVVSDFSMPAFDGLSALRLVLERAPGLPFVVCTGSVAEETAIECMKAGAWDYVLKDRLSRLPTAITGALELARARAGQAAAEAARRESEAMTLSVMDSLSSSIAVLDPSGRILAVNRAWREFAAANGASEQTIAGVGLDYLEHARRALPEESAARALAGLTSVLERREPAFALEYPCHGPGVERWFVLHATPWSAGRPGIVVAHHDVTAMRRLADQSRRWADAFALCALPLALVHSSTGRVLSCNPAFAQLLGLTPDEVEGEPVRAFCEPEARGPSLPAGAGEEGADRVRFGARVRRRDGSTRPVRVDSVTVRDAAGEALYRVESVLEIDDVPRAGGP